MTQDRSMGQYAHFPRFGGLKAFFAVGSTGSAARAAERLNVSASSISHQLKALEAELGVRLIENRKGKLVFTPDGARYFDQIKDPMSQILEATQTIRSMPGRKRVSLTLTPSFAVGWLMPRLMDLEHAHPDLEVNLIATTRVVDLARENVDLAIRRGSGQWDGFFAEALLEEQAVPVAAPGYLDDKPANTPQAALKSARILSNTTVAGEWDHWCAARGLEPPDEAARYNLETYELTIQAARDGLGLALGRKPLIDPLIASGDLVAPFDVENAGNASYYVVSSDAVLRSDVKRLREWLLRQQA